MVKNKIFDIAPPPDQKAAEETPNFPDRKMPSSGSGKKLVPLMIGAAILTAAVLSYFIIPHKAKVELWPEKRTLEEAVTAAIKGKVLESEKEVSQTFLAQGKKMKSTKAQGVIRVYNNYSSSPQTLVATTRFISSEGKLFRMLEKAVIPGTHYEGGKLVEGFIDLKVAADQPGDDYNIDESVFSIPGFAGTPKYTAFYGKSFSPMSGGAKEEVAYVTERDINNAKEILSQMVLAENNAALKSMAAAGGYLLIDEAISAGAVEFQSSAKPGQESDNFSAQAKTAARAMVFEERTLADFSKKRMEGKLASGEKLIERFLKTAYSFEKVDWAKNELSLKVSISAQSHSVPEDIKIKEMIKNKDLAEIENILKGLSQVVKARVEFWPFWVNLAPDDPDKIEVVVHLDP